MPCGKMVGLSQDRDCCSEDFLLNHKKNMGKVFVEAIDDELERRKWGAISRMEKALGVAGQGWWQARRKTEDIYIGAMVEILEHLGLDPGRFVTKVLGKDSDLVLDQPIGEPPEIVVRAWERFRSKGPLVETVAEANLETLDRMRYAAPKEAIRQALTTLGYCSRPMIPRLLGVAGSTWRLLLDLEKAEHALYAGLKMLEELKDPRAILELAQRLCYVRSDQADFAGALRLSEKIAMGYLRLQDRIGFGKSLVDQTVWLSRLDRFQEAINMGISALDFLPETEARNRCATYQVIAYNFREINDLEKAWRYLRLAEEISGTFGDKWCQDKLLWLRGNLLSDLGRTDEAAEILWKAVEMFATTNLSDMALATCDLVRVELLAERPAVAREAAQKLRFLVEPLRDNPVVSAAISDLFYKEGAALTLALVQDVRFRLESELIRGEVSGRLNSASQASR
jgi:tetratricopeptide (TPR) repeat protein